MRSATSRSSDTAATLWCTLTPTRTSLGVYRRPRESVSPVASSRPTISSSAPLLGAHTRRCGRSYRVDRTLRCQRRRLRVGCWGAALCTG